MSTAAVVNRNDGVSLDEEAVGRWGRPHRRERWAPLGKGQPKKRVSRRLGRLPPVKGEIGVETYLCPRVVQELIRPAGEVLLGSLLIECGAGLTLDAQSQRERECEVSMRLGSLGMSCPSGRSAVQRTWHEGTGEAPQRQGHAG